MVREPAAARVKELVALLQRVEKITQRRHRDVAGALQTLDPGVEHFRLVHQKSIVRAKCRKHPESGCGGGHRSMMPQVITGIIAGTKGAHVEFFKDALS